jgi:V/A-type H+-transporting ATPase subunit B
MKDGIGSKTTRKDHSDVSNQLYMAYAEGTRARGLVRIVGVVGLSDRERTWLQFADQFEQKFVNQGTYENRSIEQTLEIAWDLLSILPEEDLIRIREAYIEEFHPAHKRDK